MAGTTWDPSRRSDICGAGVHACSASPDPLRWLSASLPQRGAVLQDRDGRREGSTFHNGTYGQSVVGPEWRSRRMSHEPGRCGVIEHDQTPSGLAAEKGFCLKQSPDPTQSAEFSAWHSTRQVPLPHGRPFHRGQYEAGQLPLARADIWTAAPFRIASPSRAVNCMRPIPACR